jgi:hypothetical protein
MKKFFKIIAIVVFALLFICGAWFFGTRSYLRSDAFLKRINTPELQFNARDGYSPYPGYFVFKDFSFTGFSKAATYQVKAQSVSFRFNFMNLFRNHVSINGLSADGVTIVVGNGPESNLKKTAAEEAAEKKAEEEKEKKEEEEALARGEKKELWVIEFSNVAFKNLSEVKVLGWDWQGKADLNASFYTDTDGHFALEESEINARELNVILDGNKFGSIAEANIQTSIKEFDLDERAYKVLLPKVDTSWKLKGKLDKVDTFNAYLKELNWLKFTDSSLEMDGDIGIKDGFFRDNSNLKFSADTLHIAILQQTIIGPASVHWQVKDKNQLDLKFGKFVLNKGRDGSGEGFLITLVNPDKKILNDWKVWDAQVKLPPSRLHRIQFLQQYIPKSIPLALEKGEGSIEGNFRAGSNVSKSGGELQMKIRELQAVYKKELRFNGSANAKIKMSRMDPQKGEMLVSKADFAISDLSFLDKKNWRGSLELSEAKIKYEDPMALSSRVSVTGDNLQPVMAFLIKDKSFPNWMLSAFDLKNPKVDFNIKATETSLSVRDFEAKAGDLGIKGWMDQSAKVSRARFLLSLGMLTGGYGIDGDKSEWKIANAKAWYEEEGRSKL